MTDGSSGKRQMGAPHKEENNWVIMGSLVVLALVALAAALIYTRAVMIPFVVALFIVALVSPIEDFQVKWLRLPRAIAIVVTLLVVLSVIALVSLFVAQATRTIAYTAGEYSANFAYMANKLLKPVKYIYREEKAQPIAPNDVKSQGATGPNDVEVPKKPAAFELFPLVKDTTEPAILDVRPRTDLPAKEPAKPTIHAAKPGDSNEPNEPNEPNELAQASDSTGNQIDTKQIVRDLRNYIFNILTNAVGTIFGLISGVFFVIIFVIFLLLGRNPYAEHSQVYTEVVQRIRRYVGIKVAISAITGLLVWTTLTIIGLKLAGVFGVLAFLLNFIPSIGSAIATILPIPIAVVQFQSSPWMILLAVAIPGAIQNILGNIIEPKLQGEGLNLHPVTVLLALSFWGLLWGIVGMFLAAPITAAIRIVLMQFETFRPVADLLAGDFSNGRAKVAHATAAVKTASVPTRSEETEPAGSPGG